MNLRLIISEPDEVSGGGAALPGVVTAATVPPSEFCSCGQRLPLERELIHNDENGDDCCSDCCGDSACQAQRAAMDGLFGAIQRHPSSKPVVDRAVLRAVMEPRP